MISGVLSPSVIILYVSFRICRAARDSEMRALGKAPDRRVDRRVDRQTDRQIGRQIDKRVDRQTDI